MELARMFRAIPNSQGAAPSPRSTNRSRDSQAAAKVSAVSSKAASGSPVRRSQECVDAGGVAVVEDAERRRVASRVPEEVRVGRWVVEVGSCHEGLRAGSITHTWRERRDPLHRRLAGRDRGAQRGGRAATRL